MIEEQKRLNDATIAKAIQHSKSGKAELKKQLVKTLMRQGHTRASAQQLVKESWGK